MPLRVEHSATGRVAFVTLIGEHDIGTAVMVRRVLAELVHIPLVVLDLEQCRFLDSTILGTFMSSGKAMASRGGRLIAINASGTPAKAMRITGVDRLLSPLQDRGQELALGTS